MSMSGSALQDLQILSVWASLLSILACFARIIVTRSPSWNINFSTLAVYSIIFLLAITSRLVVAPATVIHENSHGYEYIRSAFGLQGYFFHGSCYYAFFYPISQIFGTTHSVVFTSNAVLSAVSCVLIGFATHAISGSKTAGFSAAILYTFWAPILRISQSESMFPLGLFLMLCSIVASALATRRQTISLHLLFFCCLTCLIQTRPTLACFGLLLLSAHVYTSMKRHREHLRSFLPGLIYFSLATLPWLAFRLSELSSNGLPSFMNPEEFHLSALFSAKSNLLLHIDWIPVWFVPLATLGTGVVIWRRTAAGVSLLLAIVILFFFSFGSSATSILAALRTQSPVHMLLVVAAASSIAAIPNRHNRFNHLALLILSTLSVFSFFKRIDNVRESFLPQLEFKYLSETASQIQEDCVVVTADRFLANRKISTEYPTWLHKGPVIQRTAFIMNQPDYDGFCAYFYQGLSCQIYTWQELSDVQATPNILRENCRLPANLRAQEPQHCRIVEAAMDVDYFVPSSLSPTFCYIPLALQSNSEYLDERREGKTGDERR